MCGDSDTTPSINVTRPRKIRTSLNRICLLVLQKKAIKTKLLVRNLFITKGIGNEKYAEGVTESVYRRFIWKMHMDSHTDSVSESVNGGCTQYRYIRTGIQYKRNVRKVFNKMYKKGVGVDGSTDVHRRCKRNVSMDDLYVRCIAY